MRILYVTPGFPYPLTSGFLRQYHFIRELSARHVVRLVSIVGADFSPDHATAMAPFLEGVHAIPSTDRSSAMRRKAVGRLRAWLDPAQGDGTSRRLRQVVADCLREQRFDALVVSGKRTYPTLHAAGHVPVVADLCDATSMRLRGEMRHTTAGRRVVLALEYAHMRELERRLVREADHLLFASARDRDILAPTTLRHRASVVPNGVDLEYWRRRSPALGTGHIVFTGAMSYPPNEDAALHLIGSILPQVRRVLPQARLWIVGRDPRPRLLEAGRNEGVTVTGTVEDVRPYLERASVLAAPLRFGAGIQNKLLEAMAMEVPVVSTPLAAAGLRTADGREPPLLLAEDAGTFAAALIARLGEVQRNRRPDRAGRDFVEHHFAWRTSGEQLEEVLAQVTAAAERASNR
jgi:sugar transferase (PEP-CTERM/EpsH1 system associated)